MIGSRRTGKDYARRLLKEVLPRLELLHDTGLTKKPARRRGPSGKPGGRHAQPTTKHSYWWPLYRIPPLTKLTSPKFGAYPETPGNPETSNPRRRGSASLLRVLVRQGLISGVRRRSSFSRGSVQWAFQATGPP
jgi:hypothetical protein